VPLADGRVVAVLALCVVFALAVWLVLQSLVLGSLTQARAQHVLYAQLREQLAAQTAPLGAVDPGKAVAVLSVPTLGLEQVVVEGTASGDLQSGPGHRRDTPLPGQRGVSLVYGKALTSGAPFRTIGSLVRGDGISVTTAQGTFLYRVDGVRRAGDPLPAATTGGRLTLVSVDVGSLMPGGVVYVDATLQSEPVVGAGHVRAVPDSEKAMSIDKDGLPLLVLAMALLTAAAVAVVEARRHVPAAVVWVLGAPVLVAGLWAVTQQVDRLLPNLF